jgi:hypothetical protein
MAAFQIIEVADVASFMEAAIQQKRSCILNGFEIKEVAYVASFCILNGSI